MNQKASPSREATAIAGASQRYTNIPIIPSVMVALIGAALTIGAALLAKSSVPYVYSLIHERGVIQYLTLFGFWFAAGMLLFKSQRIAKERSAFALPFIKDFTKDRDVVGNQTILAQQLLIEENTDAEQKNLILVNRINKGIKQLNISNSPAEVANVLQTVSATDSAIIDSSYILIKFMVWVIPVLGFLGTVIGMSQSIGSFDAVLRGIKDVGFQGMQENLGKVTAGLATAFDTTFLALILSAIINFQTNILQKREEDLLSDVDDFTTENIVNKLSLVKPQMVPEPASFPDWEKLTGSLEALSRELKNMGKQNQVNAEAMQQQLGAVVEAIGEIKNQGAADANGDLPAALKEFSQALKENADTFKAMGELGQLMKSNSALLESLKSPIEEMASVNRKLGELYGRIYKTNF